MPVTWLQIGPFFKVHGNLSRDWGVTHDVCMNQSSSLFPRIVFPCSLKKQQQQQQQHDAYILEIFAGNGGE